MGLLRAFDRLLDLLMGLACLLLGFVIVSVCLEVFLRYFLNRPQVWVIELSEYSLLYILFCAVAWVLREEGHVTVDLLVNRLGVKARSVLSILSYLICFCVSAGLLWYGSVVTFKYYEKGIYNPTILEIPTAAILVIIPIGGLTLFLQAARGVCKNAALLLRSYKDT